MKKILTLFAILFAMVGTMKVQADTRTVTMTVPDKYNGWYAAIYYQPNSMWSSPDNVESVIGGFDYLELYNYDWHNYIYQDECREIEESYPLNMSTVPEEPCWFPNDWDWRNSDKYHTPFCGKIVNNTFSYVADMDYQNRYVGYFLVSDMKIDAGVEWVKLYAYYQDNHIFTDEDVIDSDIFGKMELEANADPQNPTDFYTTFYSGSDDSFDFIVVTPDVEVFTINVDGDLANLVPFTEDTIPATLPVLLRSKTNKIIIARSDWESTTTVPSNALHGGLATVEANSVYTLAAEDNILAFYKYELTSIPDHKAYLQLPAGTPAPRRIAFGTHTATDVENTAADVQAEKILLDGQLFILKNGNLYNVQGALVK